LSRDEKGDSAFKEKGASFTYFEFFLNYRMNLGIGSMMQPVHINLAVPKVDIKIV
jgi:hypothetical protein